MSLFLRNLAKYGQDITIEERNILPPVFGTPDASLDFTNSTVVKSIVSTKRGVVLFDGVSTDQRITHLFTIVYIAGVTQENWITFKGRRFDIIDVENCCEVDNILKLRCDERGTKVASEA